MPRCDYLQTTICVGRGEMVKSNQSPPSAALLEKDSIADLFTYLEIKLSLKLVYYCVFFSCESNLIAFNPISKAW